VNKTYEKRIIWDLGAQENCVRHDRRGARQSSLASRDWRHQARRPLALGIRSANHQIWMNDARWQLNILNVSRIKEDHLLCITATMQPPSTLTTLSTLLFLTTANATCYGFGHNWSNRDQAIGFVLDACTMNNGMFTGTFKPGQTKSMCPRDSTGLNLLFEVQYVGSSSSNLDLSNVECSLRLANDIRGCGKGGQSTVNGWRYRLVPLSCCFFFRNMERWGRTDNGFNS